MQNTSSDWIERGHIFALRVIKMVEHLPHTPGACDRHADCAGGTVDRHEPGRGTRGFDLAVTLHKTGIARREVRVRAGCADGGVTTYIPPRDRLARPEAPPLEQERQVGRGVINSGFFFVRVFEGHLRDEANRVC